MEKTLSNNLLAPTIFLCSITVFSCGLIYYFISQKPRDSAAPCGGLLHGGEYDFSSTTVKWRPLGCSLKIYSKSETEKCLSVLRQSPSDDRKDSRAVIVFIGDSRIRQLRDEFFSQLTGMQIDWLSNKSLHLNWRIYLKHTDTVNRLASVILKFIWTEDIWSSLGKIENFTANVLTTNEVPDLILIGNGIWTMRYCTKHKMNQTHCFSEYRRMFQKMLPSLSQLAAKIHVLWVPQNPLSEKVQDDQEDATFTTRTVKAYNHIAHSVLQGLPDNNITYWTSFELTFSLKDSLDGMHIGPRAKYFDIQILLNLLCNPGSFDEDGSTHVCCAKPATVFQRIWTQIVTAVIIVFFILWLSCKFRRIYLENITVR